MMRRKWGKALKFDNIEKDGIIWRGIRQIMKVKS